MNSQYLLVETNDGASLQNKNGKELISYVFEDAQIFKVCFYNDVIDSENMATDAEKRYGRVHKIRIECAESQLNLCKNEFIKFTVGSFIGNLVKLVGMDWEDIIECTYGFGVGKFYYGKVNSYEEYEAFTADLINIVSAERAIICMEAGMNFGHGMDAIEEIVNPLRVNDYMFQYFWNENIKEEIIISVWTFNKNA